MGEDELINDLIDYGIKEGYGQRIQIHKPADVSEVLISGRNHDLRIPSKDSLEGYLSLEDKRLIINTIAKYQGLELDVLGIKDTWCFYAMANNLPHGQLLIDKIVQADNIYEKLIEKVVTQRNDMLKDEINKMNWAEMKKEAHK